jgi:L-ascorbate metabolism protein UlaG (beta-lactamase superfamily)
MKYSFSLLPVIVLLHCQSAAQDVKHYVTRIDTTLNQKGDEYMNRQSLDFLQEIDATLVKHPPQLPETDQRRLSLRLVDAVMHDRFAAYRKPVQDFYHQRITRILDAIEKTKVKKGAMVWKVYNMGFIVRTKTVTFAFDLVSGANSGSPAFALPPTLMNRLIDQCDALFLSHYHRDHAELSTAQRFIDAGKPVVAPPQIWKDMPIHESITHLKRESNTLQTLKLKNGQELKVVVYPGHQMAKTENNVPVVISPEGISFSHMGDQINEGAFMQDYDWIDHVAENHRVDVLIPPCWTNEIYRIVKGFNPKLVIPGHENELGHPIDDRVPFWGDAQFLQLTYPELKKSAYKTLVMTWGESFHYVAAAR